jgi:hypothetical protein
LAPFSFLREILTNFNVFGLDLIQNAELKKIYFMGYKVQSNLLVMNFDKACDLSIDQKFYDEIYGV